MTAIRVLVAEDSQVYRHTLVAVLELEDDLQVVAALASGDRIVPVARVLAPDVAVLDLDLPGVDGLAAAAALRAALPACRVLILTGLAVAGIEPRVRACGAAGYLSKAASAADIVAVVRRIAGGRA
ncbi:response regulator [Dactylosporangium sp. NBC_01737]|uniref:response regulator n=1 Tax=Dactylosporangium sp. NBC_01737 TaxID=2975959 RepID=UPI002E160A5C|nr:response regulator [Dactylosporangium sp. NBC_01737]